MKTNQKIARVIVAFCVLFCTVVAHADAVTDWNAIMQTTVASSNAFFQGRNAAIVEIAVFEAVNTIAGDYEPYVGTLTAPHGASPDAAAIVAAHDTLVALYPAMLRALIRRRLPHSPQFPTDNRRPTGSRLAWQRRAQSSRSAPTTAQA